MFRDEKAFIDVSYFEQLRDHEVRAGDLVIASLGEELPRACIVPELNGPAIVKADCIRARIHPQVDTRWVLHMLMAPATRDWATSRIKGVGRPRLGMAGIRQIPIPVPPLTEQKRIVAALEGYFSRITFASSSVQAAKRRLETLAKRIVDARLDALHVRTSPLLSILAAPLANGRSVPTDVEGFPVLRLTALRDGTLDLSERKGGRWTAADAQQFLVQKDDFFISRGNGSLSLVGRGGLLSDEPDAVAFPDTMIRIRVDRDQVLPEFLSLVWGSRKVREQIEKSARTTAGIYKINQRMIQGIQVPVPSVTVQQQIIADVCAAREGIGRARGQIQQTRVREDYLRSSLLAQAFTGRLVRQNPLDEPASVLLERLRGERGAPGPTLGTRRGRSEKAPQKETLL
ncbi:restriction endonuclease subunit S [Actinomadura sp. 7K534]|uniref:restriction endonuclease subunit S n=1 Tax=Actinomadura sp. 7K534 TaxID=2530366 RepID=UPI001404B01F|nr:restriction endonuclease subunit S [Actinomadura sp. 7K534]